MFLISKLSNKIQRRRQTLIDIEDIEMIGFFVKTREIANKNGNSIDILYLLTGINICMDQPCYDYTNKILKQSVVTSK